MHTYTHAVISETKGLIDHACKKRHQSNDYNSLQMCIHVNSPIRDILAIPLRLPQAITTATKREELEVISAMGAGRLYVHTLYEINFF